MHVRKKLYYCVAGNFVSLALVMGVIGALNDGTSSYFQVGPHENLVLVSVHVNTWTRWFLALLFIGMLRVCDVIVNEIGSPVLGFNIYNPDKRHITEFSKNELQFLANSMWFINAARDVLMTVIAVTQIDLALGSVLMSQVASVYAVRLLLNEKTFASKPRQGDDRISGTHDGGDMDALL